MKRTFLVTLNAVDDPDNTAADIQESLQLDGFEVVDVKPWASPNAEPTQPSQFPSGL